MGNQTMMQSIDAALKLHGDAVLLRSQRAEVLAVNLANADTPHYKAQDFSFKDALNAMHSRDRIEAGHALTTTHHAHIGDGDDGAAAQTLLYRVPHAPSLDGNTVEADSERSEIAENAIGYLTSLRFLTGRIQMLRGAIRGE